MDEKRWLVQCYRKTKCNSSVKSINWKIIKQSHRSLPIVAPQRVTVIARCMKCAIDLQSRLLIQKCERNKKPKNWKTYCFYLFPFVVSHLDSNFLFFLHSMTTVTRRWTVSSDLVYTGIIYIRVLYTLPSRRGSWD